MLLSSVQEKGKVRSFWRMCFGQSGFMYAPAVKSVLDFNRVSLHLLQTPNCEQEGWRRHCWSPTRETAQWFQWYVRTLENAEENFASSRSSELKTALALVFWFWSGDLDDSNNSADGVDQQSIQNLGPNVQLITLNTEGKFVSSSSCVRVWLLSQRLKGDLLVLTFWAIFQRTTLLAFGWATKIILKCEFESQLLQGEIHQNPGILGWNQITESCCWKQWRKHGLMESRHHRRRARPPPPPHWLTPSGPALHCHVTGSRDERWGALGLYADEAYLFPYCTFVLSFLFSDLLHIHSNCRTPEKMALTLLDYLFDRETQACSNLSGMGKHSKKQLDPLMIYGIRCEYCVRTCWPQKLNQRNFWKYKEKHWTWDTFITCLCTCLLGHLIYKFEISEADWHRIKLNIDSKCRTAHRRRTKGLPLTAKSMRGKATPVYVHKDGFTAGGVLELGMTSDQLGNEGELLAEQVSMLFLISLFRACTMCLQAIWYIGSVSLNKIGTG